LLDASQKGGEAAEPPSKKPAAKAEPHAEPAPVEEFQISEEPTVEAAQYLDGASSAIPLEAEAVEETRPRIPEAKPPIEIPAAREAPKPPKAPEPEPEFELEQEYELVLDAEPLVPAYDQKPPETPIAIPPPESVAKNSKAAPPAGSGFASDQFLADLAKEIDSLGLDELSPRFSGSTPGSQPPVAAKPEAASRGLTESGPLKEVFDEFRAELGEMGAEDEDLETHYNLGIAFREMGLLEEAISEFQKVAKASDSGRAFRYTMQCCTLLGLAFMEKGQPAIAAIWYERALLTPGMDPESTLALRYDLGVAQESAGELDAALKSFSHVYAMNIDYRDVGERIAALQKPIR
jgi:tetratricopeptide (TPR) repeat protein